MFGKLEYGRDLRIMTMPLEKIRIASTMRGRSKITESKIRVKLYSQSRVQKLEN